MAIDSVKDFPAIRNKRLQALGVLSQTLAQARNIQEIFLATVEQISIALPTDHVIIISINLPKRTITNYMESGGKKGTQIVPSFDELMDTPIGWAIEEWRSALTYTLDRKHTNLDIITRNVDLESGPALIVPITFQGELLGVISVFNRKEIDPYESPDLDFLQTIANQLAIAIDNDRIQQAERKQREQSDTLREVARILNNSQNQQRLLELILDQLNRVVEYDSASIMLIENNEISIVASRKIQIDDQLGLPKKISAYPHIQEAIEYRKPVIIPDVKKDVRWNVDPYSFHIRCWMGVPLFGKDQTIGLLNVESIKPGYYTQNDVSLAVTFANQASIAIENANLHAAERKRIEQMDALRATVADISAELELPKLLSAVLERATSLLNATGGDLGLFNEEKQDIEIVVSHNMGKDYAGTHMKVGEGAMGCAVEALHPVIVNDYSQWDKASIQYKDFNWHAVIAAPFIIGGRVVGTIGIVDANPQRRFTQSDQNLLNLFAQNAAIAVDNARLYQSTKEAAERRAVLHRVSQQIVGVSLDPEGIYTAIHHAAIQLMPSDAFVITQMNEINLMIEPVFFYEIYRRVTPQPYPASQGLSGLVVSTGETIYIPDAFDDTRVENFVHFAEPNQVRSIIAVPMRLRGKVVGMLSTQSYKPDAYTPEDQYLLEMLATYAAIALDNAQLFMDIQYLAITDSLTGIYNRRHLFELGQREFIRARRFKRPLSIIMIDIDHFKNINDAYGHSTGDHYLRELAQLLNTEVREIDIVGRYGGEEFTVILPETGLPRAREIAERLRKKVEKTFKSAANNLTPITISLGVSELDHNSNSFADIVKQADVALYSAKNAGRNQVIADSPN
jgi:diguanylate cyclase (GGDEF)-like protein